MHLSSSIKLYMLNYHDTHADVGLVMFSLALCRIYCHFVEVTSLYIFFAESFHQTNAFTLIYHIRNTSQNASYHNYPPCFLVVSETSSTKRQLGGSCLSV